ncbi:interleukin-17C isoform X2 [Engraulis encrasicolus]|uniref:interleukin-17C isoform X2 n=1 Tax=Engraulis encrasicolus TaxID=184585 RepID=UPI002FD2CE2F
MNTRMLLLLTTVAIGIMCCASDSEGCKREDRAWKHLRKHWRHGHPLLLTPTPVTDSEAPKSCRDFIQDQCRSPSKDLSNRSLSPWRYRIDEDENRIPQRIGVAECLCNHCIINGKEDSTYNSVPVMQTMMFVRRTPCPAEPGNYTFKTEFKSVPVACTCVTPIS